MRVSACRSAARLTLGPRVQSRPLISRPAASLVLARAPALALPKRPRVKWEPKLNIVSGVRLRQASTVAALECGLSRRKRRLRNLLILLGLLTVLYNVYSPFRHSCLAVVRCTRIMKAVILDVIDYQRTFAAEDKLGGPDGVLTDEERAIRRKGRKECHRRSAERMLVALKKNSGVYVKIGQHLAAVQVLPKEWTETMTPLQDQCAPTPVEEIDAMLRADLGLGIDDLFVDFNPQPIGVASLAQVHRAIDRRSGLPVAVKVQHADLQEFAAIDMATTNFAIHLVKHIFPDFEFGWLGEEMDEMLPLEMNFRHEAANSKRCREDFHKLEGRTSLYLPQVFWAEQRCLVMEYIEGARIDDLAYLKRHHIDRNQVSQEIARIFAQMVYLNGFFHADPHHGNLLIRPTAPTSASPFNFDICLLDHGQYFDVPQDLRVNYAHFWLSLMSPTSEKTTLRRKKYARLVGNIDDEMYPFLESAITGRVSLDKEGRSTSDGSLLSDAEASAVQIDQLRAAISETEGTISSVFELLRTVPRRLVMILKLSDLQRSLDYSLATTHGANRIYMILGQYCAKAVWRDDKAHVALDYKSEGITFHLLKMLVQSWLSYTSYRAMFGFMELSMDVHARIRKVELWLNGLAKGGLEAASQEMAGLKA